MHDQSSTSSPVSINTCKWCDSDDLRTRPNAMHIELYCGACDRHIKFLSKRELGEQPRSVRSSSDVRPGLRKRVLERDGHRCVCCGAAPIDGVLLQIGHIVSVKDGLALGASND